MPTGKTSVNPMPCRTAPEELVNVSVRVDGTPPVTITGLNDLLILIWAAKAVNVAETAEVLWGPSALLILPIGMVLLHGPAPLVTTSNEKSQLVPAAIVAPSSWARVAPGLTTIVGEPEQLVLALAGFAIDKPELKVLSSTETLVRSPFEVLVTVIFTREIPPEVTEAGEKLLLPVMPVVTFRVALTLAGIVPPLDKKSAG
jgi:hypothetical protein